MQDSVQTLRLARSRRAHLLALAAFVSAIPVAGCGGSSRRPTAASPAGAIESASNVASTTPATSARTLPALAFARCMRANGVPNLPDPTAGGNILLHPGPGGIDPTSPAFDAAMPKCQKLHPLPGMPGPGQATHPSKQTLAQAMKVSQCVRSHGVPWFPDPRTSVPANASPGTYGSIADDNGAIIAIPLSDITAQTGPAYYRAADVCGIGNGNH